MKVHLLIVENKDGQIGCVMASTDADEVIQKFKAIREAGGKGWKQIVYFANPLPERHAKFSEEQMAAAKPKKSEAKS